MPSTNDLLRRLSERGRPRGATAVFSAAARRRSVPVRPLVAAAVVLAIFVGAGIVAAGDGTGAGIGLDRSELADRTTTTSTTAAPDHSSDAVAGGPPGDGPVASLGDGSPVTTHLEAHASCSSLLERLRVLGTGAVGPHGFAGGISHAEAAGGTAGADEAAASAPTGSAHSRSNVQETGIDEADLLKTDGELIVAVARGRLQVVSVAGRSLLATMELPSEPDSLFFIGSTVVVIGAPVRPSNGRPGFETPVVVVDLTEPGEPMARSTTWIEGVVVTSRLQGGVVRLVTADSPRFSWNRPTDGSEAAAADATARNRQLVASSTLGTWLPDFRTVDPAGRVVASGPAASCSSTYTPSEQSGFDTTTVLTLDPATGSLDPGTGVAATPLVVYASEASLYIVSAVCCGGAPEDARSDVHRFDLTRPDEAPYRASGSVRGVPVDQFALSESAGLLRIATTYVQPNGGTDSAIWMLTQQGPTLALVGSVTGLGEEGERIYSVRYHDGFAYVVTFVQTDPLYVVDLRNPGAPRVLGELHVPGFSTFLQHLGSGRLLGVGRNADETTGQTQGLQLSLFDVSDPAAPARTGVLRYEHGTSTAEYDHLAFLHWAAEDLVVVPLEEASRTDPCLSFAGALLLQLDGTSLGEIGRVSHGAHAGGDDPSAPLVRIHRSAVAGGSLVTMSDLGLAFGDLKTGNEQHFTAFAGRDPAVEHVGCEPEPPPDPDDDDGSPLL